MGATGVCTYFLSLCDCMFVFFSNSMAGIRKWSRLNMIFMSIHIIRVGAVFFLSLSLSLPHFVQRITQERKIHFDFYRWIWYHTHFFYSMYIFIFDYYTCLSLFVCTFCYVCDSAEYVMLIDFGANPMYYTSFVRHTIPFANNSNYGKKRNPTKMVCIRAFSFVFFLFLFCINELLLLCILYWWGVKKRKWLSDFVDVKEESKC